MDAIVRAAMAKWPNVPNVFGWLKLDARGNWRIKSVRHTAAQPVFERIGNSAVVEFIYRNIEHDEQGRWYFQNGPQRVFIELERAPWIVRLHEGNDGIGTLIAQNGSVLQASAALLDESAQPYFATPNGLAALDDRDFVLFAAHLRHQNGTHLEEEHQISLFEHDASIAALGVALGDGAVPLNRVRSADLPKQFGFVMNPRPPEGEEDC